MAPTGRELGQQLYQDFLRRQQAGEVGSGDQIRQDYMASRRGQVAELSSRTFTTRGGDQLVNRKLAERQHEVIRIGGGGDTGIGVEITQPSIDAIAARARDMRPFWERIKELGWLDDPSAYIRPDRKIGGIGQPDRDGVRRNWGEGYPKIHAKFGRTKKSMTVRSQRPYYPQPTETTDTRIIDASLHYIVTGELP